MIVEKKIPIRPHKIANLKKSLRKQIELKNHNAIWKKSSCYRSITWNWLGNFFKACSVRMCNYDGCQKRKVAK